MKKRARLSDLSGKGAFFGETQEEVKTSMPVDKQKGKQVNVQISKAVSKHTGIKVKKVASKDVSKQTSIPVKKHESKRVKVKELPTLVKFTFYFDAAQLDDLDELRLTLRKEHKIKIDKSAIVRLAVDKLIEDFKKNKKSSALVSTYSTI